MQAPNPEGMAVLWFPNKEAYSEYQKFCEEFDPMCEYEEWTKKAEAAVKRGQPKIIKVYADVNSFAGFCRRSKIKPDGMGRAAFGAFLFKDQHESRN